MTENFFINRKETTPKQSLFRFIEDIYCEQFVKEGKIRFSNIQKYVASNNDIREDVTESVAAHANEFGGVSSSFVQNEAVYILSCSRVRSNKDIKNLAKKFNGHGSLFLEIFNPNLFLQKIRSVDLKKLSKFVRINSDDIYWVDVEYSEGALKNTSEIECKNIHIFQKPRKQISPQIISKNNCLIIPRPSGGAGLHLGDNIGAPNWTNDSDPINYEEEQECRLVLQGSYVHVSRADLKYSTQKKYIRNEKKPAYVDVNYGCLEDCVRIRCIESVK